MNQVKKDILVKMMKLAVVSNEPSSEVMRVVSAVSAAIANDTDETTGLCAELALEVMEAAPLASKAAQAAATYTASMLDKLLLESQKLFDVRYKY